ncbi:LOW QUALITY PROTEIN: leucine-rich repeat and calponin homology domain-containing protein 1-like [Acipenser ruthenus]|uniref:LOW QUALITY PROTEIN: leucine-rich repeat and calponin homology domain-containing protein 1-like n=1 Tax=Acipenser ruthenus TaxID=7906 RepID=UPI002741D06E|nr:LOW QUALITY PROTEIN: leucine-rich repeat and calponin homology domain-containing protein 1-like [Acipenser ruthenus]
MPWHQLPWSLPPLLPPTDPGQDRLRGQDPHSTSPPPPTGLLLIGTPRAAFLHPNGGLRRSLHEDQGEALSNRATLCQLANHVRPRSVAIIHVPSPAMPKISAAKSRRNVQNFIDACRNLGVSEDLICHPQHILENEGLTKVARMVQALTETAAQGPL